MSKREGGADVAAETAPARPRLGDRDAAAAPRESRDGADRRRATAGLERTGGRAQESVEFKAPKVKASSPTTISFWQYVGFHVDVQKFIAEEYKKRHDPNLSLEITAFPG